LYRILLDGKAAEGNGQDPPPPDPAEGFRKLLAKHQDDGVRLAETLYGENFKLREKLREAEGRAPGDGALVLKGDDARRWEAYRSLGEPAECKKAFAERDQYRSKSELHDRVEGYDDAAGLLGWNVKAFRRLAVPENLRVGFDERKEAGETVRVPHVVVVDPKGEEKPVPLAEYVQVHAPELLPSLTGGSKVEPPVPRGMPPRREPILHRPPPDDGRDPTIKETLGRGSYAPMA
jgi:hypothetical protein